MLFIKRVKNIIHVLSCYFLNIVAFSLFVNSTFFGLGPATIELGIFVISLSENRIKPLSVCLSLLLFGEILEETIPLLVSQNLSDCLYLVLADSTSPSG